MKNNIKIHMLANNNAISSSLIKSKELIKIAQLEAESILEDAKISAKKVKDQAYETGYNDGKLQALSSTFSKDSIFDGIYNQIFPHLEEAFLSVFSTFFQTKDNFETNNLIEKIFEKKLNKLLSEYILAENLRNKISINSTNKNLVENIFNKHDLNVEIVCDDNLDKDYFKFSYLLGEIEFSSIDYIQRLVTESILQLEIKEHIQNYAKKLEEQFKLTEDCKHA